MTSKSHGPVAVLGAGNMGTALAQQIARNGHHVRAWSIEQDVLDEIRDSHLNTKYLEGISLDNRIEAVSDIGRAIEGATLLIVSVPSQVVAEVAAEVAKHVTSGQIILNVAKGIYQGHRMSEVLSGALSDGSGAVVGSMGGPAIAIEMAAGIPTAVIVGISNDAACSTVQSMLRNDSLKVQITSDVTGLELCSSMKNVYAIALGMCDGLGFGTNTKAFLSNVALEEMSSICAGEGGLQETAYGLAGIADLLTTGFSQHSRNRTLGDKMGSGDDWEQYAKVNTVEGIEACKAIRDLAYGRGYKTHLLDTIYEALFLERSPEDSIRHFFSEFAY
ncbi:MAG: NAD(P)H-dependent glycerol-3-phosphate dehydrogenase [Chloroflexi bacterium]|nr:NAD(P)H-dependent glycerol-3-phosphate dehydrogenase [Chloroflexota bacterium]